MKAKVFNHESVVEGNEAAGQPETINVPNAIKAVERMDKPSRYAPEGTPTRLQQALGTDGAAAFKRNLYAVNKAGQTAIKYQTAAKWLAGALGLGAVGEGVKLATDH